MLRLPWTLNREYLIALLLDRCYLVILRADPRRDSGDLAEAIRSAVEAERGPLVATYFGAPFFQAVIGRALVGQLMWLIPALAVLVLGVLGLLVRDARAIATVLVCAALSQIVWLAAVRVAGLVLTLASIPAAALLFVLGALAFARALEKRLPFEGLAAVFLGSLALSTIPSLAAFGAALALGVVAIALVGLLLFLPLAPRLYPDVVLPRFPPVLGLGLAAIAIAGFALVARQVHFSGTPQTMFSARDDVGASLAFFDRRFGGADFIQLDFRGDLRDPELAARLLRLTELLEGPDAFADVRSVGPVLGFLNHGFGGVHRVPTSRESLSNLWFFLEGRPDVRNLVSDQRDEAMVVLRVPSTLPVPIEKLAQNVDTAIAGSLEQGRASTKLRLAALAETFAMPTTRVDEVLDAPPPDTKAAVNATLRKWLASGDSPYPPTDAQWAQLEAALEDPDPAAKLTAVASSFAELGDPAHAAQLVESVLARQKDLRLNLRALAMVDRLWDRAAPVAARVRAQGIFADHLEPHAGPGAAAVITVTGLPMIASQLEQDTLRSIWRALAVLLGVGGFVLLVLTRTLRPAFEAALAAALTLAVAGTLGLGVDPGSLAIFLLPPLAAFVVSGSSRAPAAFALALGAASTPLLFVGSLPVSRVGAALAVGLAAVALIHSVSSRTGTPALRR